MFDCYLAVFSAERGQFQVVNKSVCECIDSIGIPNTSFCLPGVRRVRIVLEVRQPRCVSQQTGSPLSSGMFQLRGLQRASGRSCLLCAR